jgi:rare lipoprotein A (peptidoglycan hydrolase)
MSTALVSWYEDAGTTASGFHAYYGVAACGVAGPCFPFGARIEFAYGDREVTATVDDHGPYVPPRNFDLNQNTAAALGFDGVGEVRYRVLSG